MATGVAALKLGAPTIYFVFLNNKLLEDISYLLNIYKCGPGLLKTVSLTASY